MWRAERPTVPPHGAQPSLSAPGPPGETIRERVCRTPDDPQRSLAVSVRPPSAASDSALVPTSGRVGNLLDREGRASAGKCGPLPRDREPRTSSLGDAARAARSLPDARPLSRSRYCRESLRDRFFGRRRRWVERGEAGSGLPWPAWMSVNAGWRRTRRSSGR
jgi:hypothetical protein